MLLSGQKHGFATVVACILCFLAGTSLGQRPSNASVCDYYAQKRSGTNTSDSQHALVRRIVSLAFEGGSKLEGLPTSLTGILRPGRINDVDVSLQTYFNGSRPSTNVNNAGIGVNWLDDGGTEKLATYLAGDQEDLVFSNSTNQFKLFGNFFVVFSRVFGCTIPFQSLPNTSGPISLAYAHKFMNLDYNQLGYFITQLTQAGMFYGFSAQDAETIKTSLNARYNVRCAPAVTFSQGGTPQLLSLCQNPTCPLAAPVSDCDAYNNLTANGVQNSNPTSITTSATSSATSSTSTSSTLTSSTSTASTTTPAAEASKSDGSSSLSTGAIAGVAVGGAAVLVLALAVLLFFFKRRRGKTPPSTPAAPASSTADWAAGQQAFSTPTLQPGSPYSQKGQHLSYYSQGTGPPPSQQGEISRIGSPQMVQHGSWQHPVEIDTSDHHFTGPPVEMDSSVKAPTPQPSPGPDGGAGHQLGYGGSQGPASPQQPQQGYGGHQGEGYGSQYQAYRPQ
ncbi:hypothetical protein B0T24DRAFT_111594 [Lasiosphaeria ovina]|uniref:Uncharacterized protein n=1 Tax=Lasiosphaeria ovina TaxID=92902 RepID=A0AAE0JTJ4_9PEZI|nr:hypothetical protein B0T24DRAFT_111594 [Lasiosphaeria ovina]